jgi:hypothetical protein
VKRYLLEELYNLDSFSIQWSEEENNLPWQKLVTYPQVRYYDTKRNYIRTFSDVKCNGIFGAVDGRH